MAREKIKKIKKKQVSSPKPNNVSQPNVRTENTNNAPTNLKVTQIKQNTVKLDSTSYAQNKKREKNDQARQANSVRHRRRRKKNYTIHFILVFILILVVGVSLSVTVFFNINAIEVKTPEKYTSEQIVQSSQVNIGDNLFRLNLNQVKQRIIEQNVYIDDVKIERKLPETLMIEVIEAIPTTAYKKEDGYFIVSEKGRIVNEVATLDEYPNLFLSSGIDLSGYKVSDFLKENESYTTVQKVMEAVEIAGIENIKSVEIYNVNQIKLNYENRITIMLGNILEIDYKLLMVKQVIAEKIGVTEEGILDASTPKKTYFRPISMQEQKNNE